MLTMINKDCSGSNSHHTYVCRHGYEKIGLDGVKSALSVKIIFVVTVSTSAATSLPESWNKRIQV